MKKQCSKVYILILLSVIILVSACSGRGEDDVVATEPTTAKLSGVVQQSTDESFSKAIINGGSLPSFAGSVDTNTFNSLKTSPITGALILVTDAQGNTVSATAGSDGSFTVDGIEKGKDYAVVIFDARSMELLASLVQASDTTKPGQFSLSENLNLGSVVIDKVNKRAVAEADVSGKVKVDDATATMDKDGDGIISNDDVTTMQVDNIAELAHISVWSFMGEANTWAIYQEETGGNADHWTDHDGSGLLEVTENDVHEMYLRRSMDVIGPNGGNVKAIKEATLVYYADVTATYTADIDSSVTDHSKAGYFNYSEAACPSSPCVGPWGADWTSFDANSTDNNRIDGWADYRYLDSKQNLIYEGRMDNGVLEWSSQVPNNVELGKTNRFSFHESWTEPNDTGGERNIEVDGGMTFSVNKVNGGVITDLLGKKYPVMRVDFKQDFTVKVDGVIDSNASQQESGKGAFYIVARYGVSGPVFDAASASCTDASDITTCPTLSWQQGLENARYGIVSPDGDIIVSATDMALPWNQSACNSVSVDNMNGTYTIPANSLCMTSPDLSAATVIASSAMPAYDDFTGFSVDGVSSPSDIQIAAARDSWLKAMADNIDYIDVRDDNSTRTWFYLQYTHNGGALEPASWNPLTFTSYPLTATQTITLETDGRFNGSLSTDPSLPEFSDADSTFHYGLRSVGAGSYVPAYMIAEVKSYSPLATCTDAAGDSWKGCDVALTNPDGSAVSSENYLSLPQFGGENAKALVFTMQLPEVNTNNYNDVWIEWRDPDSDATFDAFCASEVSVWFTMIEQTGGVDYDNAVNETDDQVADSKPVSRYTVLSSVPISLASGERPDVATHCSAN